MKLKNGLVQVIGANIINLMISIGNGFLLPKFLSVSTYADIKTFLLYISYVGILHMGYIDGIYIGYGGKDIKEINTKEFMYEKHSLIVFQLMITFLFTILVLPFNEWSLLFAVISILPVNMVTFYKFVFQATGEFKEYRYITNLSSVLIFILNLFLIFIIKTDNSIYYMGIQVIISFAVWIYYERKNKNQEKNKISIKQIIYSIKKNVSMGVIIMLGNFMGVWITSIDRWFVKIFHSVAEFAYYSFAVTMLKFLNVVISAFSVTLYNFFCKNPTLEDISKIRKIVLVIGAGIIAIIFPLNFVIQIYLDKYVEAIPIIKVIFLAQFIMIVVNAVYLNLYKAKNMQKRYLTQMGTVTVIAIVLNVLLGFGLNSGIIAYAWATFFTAIVWLLLCVMDMKECKLEYTEWIYIVLTVIGYFLCSSFSAWIGLFVYAIWIVAITCFVFRNEVKEIFCSMHF